METINPIFIAASDLQHICIANSWRFCFIGGIAVQRWGEPRFTHDVDMTLLTGFGGEEHYARILTQSFTARRTDAVEFAVKYRVVLIQHNNGIPFDIALGAMPFEERAIDRASGYDVGGGIILHTCSAEDLIVHKAFAARNRDWADIEGIIQRQNNKLNIRLIMDEINPLAMLKESPDIPIRLKDMLTRK